MARRGVALSLSHVRQYNDSPALDIDWSVDRVNRIRSSSSRSDCGCMGARAALRERANVYAYSRTKRRSEWAEMGEHRELNTEQLALYREQWASVERAAGRVLYYSVCSVSVYL